MSWKEKTIKVHQFYLDQINEQIKDFNDPVFEDKFCEDTREKVLRRLKSEARDLEVQIEYENNSDDEIFGEASYNTSKWNCLFLAYKYGLKKFRD
jgi:hypothetical protein